MDFVSTRIGNEICNIAKAALAKYVRGPKQYCVCCQKNNIVGVVNEELEKGASVKDIYKEIPFEDSCIVIFEK